MRNRPTFPVVMSILMGLWWLVVVLVRHHVPGVIVTLVITAIAGVMVGWMDQGMQ